MAQGQSKSYHYTFFNGGGSGQFNLHSVLPMIPHSMIGRHMIDPNPHKAKLKVLVYVRIQISNFIVTFKIFSSPNDNEFLAGRWSGAISFLYYKIYSTAQACAIPALSCMCFFIK